MRPLQSASLMRALQSSKQTSKTSKKTSRQPSHSHSSHSAAPYTPAAAPVSPCQTVPIAVRAGRTQVEPPS